MSIHSLKDLKEAKIVGPHLNDILKVFNLSIKSLQYFKSYIPVAKTLKIMEEQKTLIEIHQKKYNKVLKTKGRI